MSVLRRGATVSVIQRQKASGCVRNVCARLCALSGKLWLSAESGDGGSLNVADVRKGYVRADVLSMCWEPDRFGADSGCIASSGR